MPVLSFPCISLMGISVKERIQRQRASGKGDEAGGGPGASVKAAAKEVMAECCSHPNFVISTGYDIPPASSWENIDAFFKAVDEFYFEKKAGMVKMKA